MFRVTAIIFLLQLFYSCKEKSKIKKSYMSGAGIVECSGLVPGARLSSPGTQNALDYKLNVWYRDSFAIEEILYFKSKYIGDSPVYELRIVQYYRFNDLRNKSIYYYHTFSDTSVCFKQFSFNDTVRMESGWGFDLDRKIKYSMPPITVGDTVMDNILYKEVRCIYKGPPHDTYVRCFFRCDKSQGPFNYDLKLSKQFGCPLTTVIYSDSTFKPVDIITKVSFIADTLTPEENKVFDAWEKFAKENPVLK